MEQNTAISFPWMQDAAKKGAVLAMIHILIFCVLYYAMPNKLTGFSYLFLIIALNLTYSVYNGNAFRSELGGYVAFGPAFKYVLVLLVTNGLINIVFAIIFLMIEPAYPDIMAQSQLDTSVYWAEKFNAPENVIEKMKDEFDFDGTKERFSFSGLLLSFGIGLIFYSIGAAIAGLIVRKRVPETL